MKHIHELRVQLLQWTQTNACWQDYKKFLWTIISQLSKKSDHPLMPSSASMVRLSHVAKVISQLIHMKNNESIIIIPGSAGVWRIAAINECGGWDDRTTSEDMDLAVRAGLMGWKFVYVGSLQVIISSSNWIHFRFFNMRKYLVVFSIGEKWAAKFVERVPLSAAALVLWSDKFIQESCNGYSQEQGLF